MNESSKQKTLHSTKWNKQPASILREIVHFYPVQPLLITYARDCSGAVSAVGHNNHHNIKSTGRYLSRRLLKYKSSRSKHKARVVNRCLAHQGSLNRKWKNLPVCVAATTAVMSYTLKELPGSHETDITRLDNVEPAAAPGSTVAGS